MAPDEEAEGARSSDALRKAAKPRDAPLFDAFPKARALPFVPLLHGPTPLEPLDVLADYFGRRGLWVKRDDLASPLYGGNKVRKFEWVLGAAREAGARRLFTVGGVASTQVTATALFGRALGFEVCAHLFDQPPTEFGRRALLADVAAGAELAYGGPLALAVPRALAALWAERRRRAYFISPGASTPLANLGYVDAALELAAQVQRGEAPRPDAVVVASGTGGTAAGLALGFGLLGWPTEVIAVRITSRLASNDLASRLLVALTARALASLGPLPRRVAARVRVFHGAIGPGYGHPTPAAREGAARLRALTGEEGEVTYSGKAIAALRAIGASPRYAGKVLLFWNTLANRTPGAELITATSLPPDLRRLYERPTVA